MSSPPVATPAPAPVSIHHKLPGGGVNWTGRGKLWVGDDHLLEVNSLFVVEWYRRFYFREIKAFTVRRTNARFVWAVVQIAVAVLFGLVAGAFVVSGANNPATEVYMVTLVMAWLSGSFAAVCLIILVINLALGPSCRCHVLTPTGWQALAAPARLWPAVQVQARIIPLIDSAQGGAPESETAAPYQGTSG